MRIFNSFIAISLLLLLIRFAFFKDGFIHSQKITTASSEYPSRVLYDRTNYLDYSEQNFAASQKFGRTLLFFAATKWCSNCAALDAEIKKRNSELPKDITVLKVDYDSDRETKVKYAVTQQTTMVLLYKNGKEEKRWIGTGSFSDLIQNIN